MPKVVPSQVVALIDQVFPNAKSEPTFPVYSANAPTLSTIVDLAERIPEELITISGEDYSDLVHGLKALAHSVEHWTQRGGDEPPRRIKGKSPVVVVREALSKCLMRARRPKLPNSPSSRMQHLGTVSVATSAQRPARFTMENGRRQLYWPARQ